MTANLQNACWPASRLGEALQALARKSGLPLRVAEAPALPPGLSLHSNERMGEWMEAAAASLELEVEPVSSSYRGVEQMVRGAAPALFAIPGLDEPRFLAVLACRWGSVVLLRPDLTVERVPPTTIRAILCKELEFPHIAAAERLLRRAGMPEQQLATALPAFLGERLNGSRVEGCWLLRLPPAASLWTRTRQARLPRMLASFTAAYAAEYALWILSWWLLGRWALAGGLDRGSLVGWALLLLTMVPFRLLATSLQGSIAIRAGVILKQHLLAGALRLDPEQIRREGAGQLLGRVIESEKVESLALNGGLLAFVAVIELAFATAVILMGAGGWIQALLLLCWTGFALVLALRYFRHRREWTQARLDLTHGLVERMVGHRTRLAQQSPENWHGNEDQELEHYLERSIRIDRSGALLVALVPQGWLLVGLLGLAPAFITSDASPALLAVGVGGVLLAYAGLQRLAAGLADVAGAAIALEQIKIFVRAAGRRQRAAHSRSLLQRASGPGERPGTLEAQNLSFGYPSRSEHILGGCNLKIGPGDRVLLEGRSGCGKSTLVSLLTGLRVPDSGLLLFGGMDQHTTGLHAWRRLSAAVPQFNQNHVLSGTFAFNLLMGRRWPPAEEDLREAEAICRELGLGELIERMPAGLLQVVGETGWQLSHGERSRLFIARALLQGAELVVLDESLGALDPESLQQALHCVRKRAPALLVIAHL